MKTVLDDVLYQISSPTEVEVEIAKARLALGVPVHHIVTEILARRQEAAVGAEQHEKDRRSNELIMTLATAGFLLEVHDDEYLNAILRVRNGEQIQTVVDEIGSVLKSRKEQKASSNSGPK